MAFRREILNLIPVGVRTKVQYRLIKSKRKTIAISFDGDGNLIVKAPSWLGKREIEEFVSSKEGWIEATARRLEEARKKEKDSQLRLESGDELCYLGEKRTLTVLREGSRRGKITSVLDRVIMRVPYEADRAFRRELLEKWYRREALTVLSEKALEFSESLGVEFKEIHIKDQKSRWGSCSSKGNLNFNWRILMAPEAVCDYVVIHELCHLVHMDHSPGFWGMVEGFCPRYRAHRKWLKEHGRELYNF